MYVVAVDFEIQPDLIEAFLPLMLKQAKTSLALEPACQTFDVCQDSDAREIVFLFEVYDDRAAFDAHLASAHFREFDMAVSEMIVKKRVRTFDLIS